MMAKLNNLNTHSYDRINTKKLRWSANSFERVKGNDKDNVPKEKIKIENALHLVDYWRARDKAPSLSTTFLKSTLKKLKKKAGREVEKWGLEKTSLHTLLHFSNYPLHFLERKGYSSVGWSSLMLTSKCCFMA